MPARRDPLRIALQVGVYVFFYFVMVWVCGPLLGWIGGYLAGIAISGLVAAAFSNYLCLRIYEQLRLADIGLAWDKASAQNLALGLIGGIGAASLVVCGPLVASSAYLAGSPQSEASARSFFFLSVMLLLGAAGEEMLFRGYGFQVLLQAWGPSATISAVGVVFAALHAGNPHATYLGLANTAGFGILFGYAFWCSRDLWLPIGLHFGWNFTLPLFGLNVSGIKMRMTGYTMQWTAGTLWSGGEYGPEGSLLTSAVLFLLFAFLWKAPIRRQPSSLLDPPAERSTCAPAASD